MNVFARDVMKKEVKTVRPDLPMADLERRFVEHNVSGFPVVDHDGTVRGVVSAHDVLAHVCAERRDVELSTAFYDDDTHMEFASVSDDWISSEVGKRADHLRVGDLMNEDVISVAPRTSLHDVASLMAAQKVHRVLVIDDRRLVGILSSSDIVRACGDERIEISFAPPATLDF